MPTVVCVYRGTDEVDNGIECLDEGKVQLLFTKFPVGTGTFKRNKFLYVQYIGPKCGIVKRGVAINEITRFTDSSMKGIAGFSTTDKPSLSFESLIHQFKNIFITDNGSFSMDQIRDEYRSRLQEEQRMMHQEGKKVKKAKAPPPAVRRLSVAPPPNPPPAQPSKQENAPLPTDQKELSAMTLRILEVLRQDNGPVNWAVLAADPVNLRVLSYGRGGIFELIKNLPNDQWLFGLFRISFFTGEARERRIIFFQWIGSNLKAVRGGSSSGIYPAMSKALAPYSYEIYLVGQSDLNAQAIINKSKNAFHDRRRTVVSTDGSTQEMKSIVFTEENYKTSLLEEQEACKDMRLEVFQPEPKRDRRKSLPSTMERSIASLASMGTVGSPEPFDTEETLDLVQANEGGLVWAIFEVR